MSGYPTRRAKCASDHEICIQLTIVLSSELMPLACALFVCDVCVWYNNVPLLIVVYIRESGVLRALAISAPQFERGTVGTRALTSSDPASLFNACRVAAQRADHGMGAWGRSHWAQGRRARRRFARLYHDCPGALADLERMIDDTRPNLLLIGAMTICFPGAIECARRAKKMLGDEVCIVLGGRHASETIWSATRTAIAQHPASPMALMAEGRIPPVFDVVVSGDGEQVVADLGEMVENAVEAGRPAASVKFELDRLRGSPGRWVVGALDSCGRPQFLANATALDYGRMMSPAEAFGVTANFSPGEKTRTAHVFSDIGRGCIYDCAFCSERFSAVGLPQDFANSADRLARNLKAAQEVIEQDEPDARPTAFVEDSTFLGMNPRLVETFAIRAEALELSIRFGGQATFDQILQRAHLLPLLKRCGLDYVFIGLETPHPDEIGGMHKDIG